MTRDTFFDELFTYDSEAEVGSAENDESAEQVVGRHSGIDIVVNPKRRSGKPTVAGTRLEPKIMAERVFGQTLSFMNSLLDDDVFSESTEKDLIEHYQDHPHDVPLVIPEDEEWFSYHKLDDINHDIYGSKVRNAYKLSVIEIADRRDYTFPRMIHAMCEFYGYNRDHMEVLRRRSYDTRFALSKTGDSDEPIQFIQDKNDLDGFFVSENGERYENYAEFMSASWDSEWPPEAIYLDHQATFGVERPPS
mgnify:CR=1 FL=1